MKKILILSANPIDTHRLRLDEEVREIEERIKRSKGSGEFIIKPALATRVEDIQQVLLDHDPQIVHFCGHGETDGLIFENKLGKAQLIPQQALANLFKLFIGTVECVVLNACLSEPQAKTINEHIPYVIGMNSAIGDTAAIKFASGFYAAIGGGRNYKDAFEFGKNYLELENIPQELIPQIFVNEELIDKPEYGSDEKSHIAKKIKDLQVPYELSCEKLRRLREAKAIETDPSIIFKLETNIESEKTEIEALEQEINELKKKMGE